MVKVQECKILLEIWRTNALKINKIKSRWIPAAESNGILFAPNEGYGITFDIIVTLYKGDSYAKVRIANYHTNIVLIEKNGEILKQVEVAGEEEDGLTDRSLLNMEDIWDFINTVDIEDIREVLDRQIKYNWAIAQEGLKGDYGANIGSVLLEMSGNDAEPEIVANVPPKCFIPRPNVGSAVIRLTSQTEMSVAVKDPALMFKIIRASFNQRRKTLQNGLGNAPELPYTKEQIAAAIAEMGLTPTIRGEALSLAQFAQLSDILGEMK